MIEKVVTGSFFTNSYVISNNGKCIVVDPGLSYANAASMIKEKYDVEAIFITHGHMDHIDSIKYFPNVPIYIHKDAEEFLYNPSLSLYDMMGMRIPFKKGELEVRVVNDLDTISLIGYEFKVLHTPGHTRGCVCYSYGTKVLSGDALFSGSCGRTDLPTGDSMKLVKSLKRIIEAYPDNYDVYPGHDEKTTIKKERSNPYIR